MAAQIRRFGRWMLVLGPLALLVLLLARPTHVQAATFTSPFFQNVSTNPPCACAYSCSGCGGPSMTSPEDVIWSDRSLRHSHTILANKLTSGMLYFTVTWDSTTSGHSQFGNGWKHTFDTKLVKTIVNVGSPESANGHYVVVYYADNHTATFEWTGSAYVTTDCAVTDVLSRPGGPPSTYQLTRTDGSEIDFLASGLAGVFRDPNGNEITLTYNGSLQLTGLEDDRGFDYVFTQNADGFVEEIDNPTHRIFTCDYDNAGNLISITTPATPDQSSGVTHEFGVFGNSCA